MISLHSPTTIYSYVCSIALGSTLSRIITQPDLNLVRGILSLAIIVRLAPPFQTPARSLESKLNTWGWTGHLRICVYVTGFALYQAFCGASSLWICVQWIVADIGVRQYIFKVCHSADAVSSARNILTDAT